MDIAFTYHQSADDAESLVEELRALGRRALPLRVDLARPGAPALIRKSLLRRLGRVDALINNAAIFDPTPMGRITADDVDRHLAVNARAPLLLTQALADLLAARFDPTDPATMGRVVNFVDMHAMGRPMRGFAAYNASKAALIEITLCTARELAPRVTVNAIAPGVIAWAKGFTPAQRRRYLDRVPLQRAGTPEDAAAAVLFLVRDAHYTTGQILRIDGGRLLT